MKKNNLKLVAYIKYCILAWTIGLLTVNLSAQCIIDINSDLARVPEGRILQEFFEANGTDAWKVLYEAEVDDIVKINNDYLNIVKRHLDETGESTSDLAVEISNAGGFDGWRHQIIFSAGGRPELTLKLKNYGYPSCSNAVVDAANVSNRNKSKLHLDSDIPNAVEDYTFVVNGNTYVKGVSESWTDYFTRLRLSDDINIFESHHIFPVNLFKRESFRKWYELVGRDVFNMNGENILENLIMLEKKTGGRGVHSNHPAYTSQIGAI